MGYNLPGAVEAAAAMAVEEAEAVEEAAEALAAVQEAAEAAA
jgi:hypothetical protein